MMFFLFVVHLGGLLDMKTLTSPFSRPPALTLIVVTVVLASSLRHFASLANKRVCLSVIKVLNAWKVIVLS